LLIALGFVIFAGNYHMNINKKLFIGVLTVVMSMSAFAEGKQKLETMEVKTETLPKYNVVDGQVESVQKATVSAQTSGTIEKLFYDVDDFVEKGEVIARIRSKNQMAGLRQAEAGFEQAKANVSEARARNQEAISEFNRIKKVFERQLVSRAQYDNARAAKQAAAARVEAANAALEAAKAKVSQAGEQLGYTEIRAPYSGIVTERLVEPGESVNVGSPLMSGISLDKMRVSLTVSQSDIIAARKQNQAKIILDDAEVPVQKLTFFPYADPATNAFKVRADLGDASQSLFPGMFVKVAIAVGETTKLTVPVSAVAYRSEVTGIYVVDDEGVPHLHQVRLGRMSGDGKIQILAGLDGDEKIALNPTQAAVYYKQLIADQAAEGDKHE
jgi:RND family efflux transporter MFP subunit